MRKIESKTKHVGIKCDSASAGESQTSGIWAVELNIKPVSTCVFLCVTLLDEIINQVSYRLHLLSLILWNVYVTYKLPHLN